jgi:hypothetical protein
MKTIQINNKHYQECDIVMLETVKTNNLNDIVLNPEKTRLATLNPLTIDSKQPCTNQHLYILSNDEIKDCDWYFDHRLNKVLKVSQDITPKICKAFDYKKVIATTDSSLMIPFSNPNVNSEYLPQIPQQFIEHFINEYNQGNVISKVLVEFQMFKGSIPVTWVSSLEDSNVNFSIKLNQNNEISILTEQKQETLEEAAENLFPINSTNGNMEMLNRYQLNNSLKQEGFIVGVKSDVARDYWFKIFKDKFIDNSNDK